jgi:DNA/RNA-binding domain of Phe-tRNA-synthetase-like protein
MKVVFAEEVKELANGISLATAIMENVKVWKMHEYSENLKKDVILGFRQTHTLDDLGKDPRVESFRRLYWLFRMDPTKIRPSSEALARRVLSGSDMPTINTVVDCNNAMSLKHFLPIGIYDADRIEGVLRVRLAESGEPITKIGGRIEVLREKELVVSDEKQIIGLGYASSDSDTTKVSEVTRKISILVYCAPGTLAQASGACLEELVTHIIRCSGGTCTERSVFG